MANKKDIAYGVSRALFAIRTFNEEKNEYEYGDYTDILGVTKVEIDAPKLSDDTYALDEVHISGGDDSPAPLEGTLSMIQATNPEFKKVIGYKKDSDNKTEYTGQNTPVAMAFIEELKNEDYVYDEILHVYYNVKPSEAKVSMETTTDKITERTFEIPIKVFRANFINHKPGPQSRYQEVKRSEVTDEVWTSLLKTVVRMKEDKTTVDQPENKG